MLNMPELLNLYVEMYVLSSEGAQVEKRLANISAYNIHGCREITSGVF